MRGQTIKATFPVAQVIKSVDSQNGKPIELGDEIELGVAEESKVPFFQNRWTFDDYQKSRRAKDKQGLDELETKGDLSYVAKGTKAKVIDLDDYFAEGVYFTLAKVRFLDGKNSGKIAWVWTGQSWCRY